MEIYQSNLDIIKKSNNNNRIIIPYIFLIINFAFTIFLINEYKNINFIIKKIPFEEFKKYQRFANDEKELEVLKWKEENYVHIICLLFFIYIFFYQQKKYSK